MKIQYKDKFSLQGKIAVVTGGAGILGREFCAGLAEFGATVVIVDRPGVDTKDLAGKLVSDYKGKAISLECDVSDAKSVSAMTDEIIARFGKVDVLLNNAASKSEDLEKFFAPFEDYTLNEWQRIMSVNLDGMFLVAQAIGGKMAQSGNGGSIIQTSSIYGLLAPDSRIYEGSDYLGHAINTPAVYSASKAGVIGLTRYLATYWATKRVRVNTLIPGGVFSGQNAQFVERYSARVPLGRMANADEMVPPVLFLASDASSYITGQNLVVDGGLSAW